MNIYFLMPSLFLLQSANRRVESRIPAYQMICHLVNKVSKVKTSAQKFFYGFLIAVKMMPFELGEQISYFKHYRLF